MAALFLDPTSWLLESLAVGPDFEVRLGDMGGPGHLAWSPRGVGGLCAVDDPLESFTRKPHRMFEISAIGEVHGHSTRLAV